MEIPNLTHKAQEKLLFQIIKTRNDLIKKKLLIKKTIKTPINYFFFQKKILKLKFLKTNINIDIKKQKKITKKKFANPDCYKDNLKINYLNQINKNPKKTTKFIKKILHLFSIK